MVRSTNSGHAIPGKVPESQEHRLRSENGPLIALLAIGLLLRLGLVWYFHSEPLYIDDEQSYDGIAVNLATRGEFATSPGRLTSQRPPLYPAFVTGLYALCGVGNHDAVRVVQSLLGLALVLVVYRLAEAMYSRQVAIWAAAFCCFYPTLLALGNLVLTEILFTLLLCLACLMLHRFLQFGSLAALGASGLLLGLGALTRSVLWVFPPFLLVFLLVATQGNWRRRVVAALVPVVVLVGVIAPWAVRNTLLQRTFTTVDVIGGYNFMMGNYEYTPLHRAWDAISMPGEKAWHRVLAASTPDFAQMTQGQRDKAALRYGLRFVAAHPGLTAHRCVVKFFDFWQLEREVIAGFSRGYWGHVPRAAVLLIAVVVCGSYVFLMLSGAFGFVVVPPVDRRMHWFILLVVGFVCAVHTATFGHSRYHVPLMPLVFIYSGAALANLRVIWQRRGTWPVWLATGIATVLVGGWIWELVLSDLPQFAR